MRKLLALLSVAALLVVAASAFAATTVSWHKGSQATIKIKKGRTVKWVWTDRQFHDVYGPGFHSKVTNRKGFTYSHTFRRKGTFRIFCHIHRNMKTIVKVS